MRNRVKGTGEESHSAGQAVQREQSVNDQYGVACEGCKNGI
jgi:hypothetical protein